MNDRLIAKLTPVETISAGDQILLSGVGTVKETSLRVGPGDWVIELVKDRQLVFPARALVWCIAPPPAVIEIENFGPFDADELVRWAETYGDPEEWAKEDSTRTLVSLEGELDRVEDRYERESTEWQEERESMLAVMPGTPVEDAGVMTVEQTMEAIRHGDAIAATQATVVAAYDRLWRESIESHSGDRA